MTSRIVVISLIVIASICAGILSGFISLHHKHAHAETELTAAHSEFQLALSTMSLRMAAMSKALERTSLLSPDIYSQIYNDAARPSLRVHERALALMTEFETVEHAEDFFAEMRPQFKRAGYPAVNAVPDQDAAAIFPAVFVEPPASRQNVFGYNIGTSPERLSAAREAIDARVIAASAPVILSQDRDERPSSFLLLYPVTLTAAIAPGKKTQAVLGAGLTPGSLFQDHIITDPGHILEFDLKIDGQSLPVTLGERSNVWLFSIPLLTNRILPDIMINGLEISLSASVFYAPHIEEVLTPVAIALLTGLFLMLLAKNLSARETHKTNLETALKAKEAELLEVHQVHAASQRVEALGRLVGGVAHDFNNILSVILGNLELIQARRGQKSAESLLDEAVTATQRGAHLTRQLLAVGRKSHLQPQRIDVTEALAESARMLTRVLPETIEVTTVPATGLWPIQIDPDGLQTALLNVGLNARDAMSTRGHLILEATNTRIPAPDAGRDQITDLAPGRYVKISVTDTGPGVAPEIVDRIFEPFFTTKHATEGSGLGLSSVLGFCKQSGGTCRIRNSPGIGAALELYFPAAERVSGEAAMSHGPDPAVRVGPRRILLAEDEESVARVLIRQLESAGHNVTRVASGDAAWRALENAAPYELLITDIVMPGSLQGTELAQKVEWAYPEIAILMISGYPKDATPTDKGVLERHPLLVKPISTNALIAAIDGLFIQPAQS